MNERDRVFARFKDDTPASPERRETLTIPRRAGASGTRSVDVVHARLGGAEKDRPRGVDHYVRAASWDRGFPAKQTSPASAPPAQVLPEAAKPVTHVMPAWEPSAAKADAAPAKESIDLQGRGRGRPREQPASNLASAAACPTIGQEPDGGPSHSQGRRGKQPASLGTRRVADPFDATDDGANCIRCGYAIQPARERRGLMTCAGCK